MIKLCKSFIELIYADPSRANETKRITLLVRFLTLIIEALLLVLVGFCAVCNVTYGLRLIVPLILLYGVVFYISVVSGRTATMWLFVASVLIMVTVCLWEFGWICGVQTFTLMLVLLYYFYSYNEWVDKAIFSFVIFVAYMGFYFVFAHAVPFNHYTEGSQLFLRFAFMADQIACTSVCALIFSKDSQKMERKLIDYNKKLQDRANKDPLTGLWNRGRAMDILSEISTHSNEMFSLCICDIDHFKRVNDTYGHDAGDRVLKEVARILNNVSKKSGFAARWGGEEFIIAFPGLNGDEARSVIYDIQREMSKMQVECGGENIVVTLTYGLVEYDFGLPLDDNIKEADGKLYLGKEQGRNTLVY